MAYFYTESQFNQFFLISRYYINIIKYSTHVFHRSATISVKFIDAA